MMKLNLPNKLTLLRIILIPFIVFFIVYPIFGAENYLWSRIIAAAVFLLAAITDFLDGSIARRKGIVTRFGKFMDPLADKFMVFCALLAMNFSDHVFPANEIVPQWLMQNVFFWATVIIFFRELAITSMRLVISNESGVVIAADKLAKVKTVSQFVGIIVILLEPVAFPLGGFLSLAMILLMTVLTVLSGLNYIKKNWGLLDPTK